MFIRLHNRRVLSLFHSFIFLKHSVQEMSTHVFSRPTSACDSDTLKHEAWSWEKNKKFELALLDVNEEVPDRWEKIATMVGGKSAQEVEEHYKALVQDVKLIEFDAYIDDYDENNAVAEPQSIQQLATTLPLGLCLNVENEASFQDLLTPLNSG
uniref:Myb-like domain-containing protein n=1 Tax=Kalanchoe fedtschenkoi TaxID=63787 RepID=A0A7N0USZ9_KALFE